MIRVNDDWVIEVEPLCYTLKKDLHRTELSRDKKKMVPVYAVKSYHPSLRRALERLHEEIIRDKLSEPLNGLREVAEAIREAREEWHELVQLVTEGKRELLKRLEDDGK